MKKPAAMFVAVLVACLLGYAAAVETPWMLGDEDTVACFTLSTKQDIPKPVGLNMRWTIRPPVPMDSSSQTIVRYIAQVSDNFWTQQSNRDLLGNQYDHYYRLCVTEPTGCDAAGDCCIFHSNVHSCRSEAGSCEPWVKPVNASGDVPYTLVTHTAAQTGGMEEWTHPMQLEPGDWVIIAHVKFMTFQCAVGATRLSVEPPPKEVDNTKLIVAIVVPLVVVLASLGGALALLGSKHQGAVRDISDAPKEGTVTLMFTDIQDSTNLWSNYTASMAASLDIHHDIIREVMKKHHGYEVKTAGDSFMIAVKSPQAGVKIARDIQLKIHETQWPRCITGHYLDDELEDEPDALISAEHGAAYHGCRVRIGVHTGTPDCVFDEVTKGYDYYGPDVNLAARVEAPACGGQILLSDTTYAALQEEPVEGITPVAAGTIIPKGLREVKEVFTAKVDALPERTFALLKHDPKMLDQGDDDDDVLSVKSGASVLTSRTGHTTRTAGTFGGMSTEEETLIFRLHAKFRGEVSASRVRDIWDDRKYFLKTMLKAIPPKKQNPLLKDIATAWRAPFSDKAPRDTNINNLLVNVIVAEGARHRQNLVAEPSDLLSNRTQSAVHSVIESTQGA